MNERKPRNVREDAQILAQQKKAVERKSDADTTGTTSNSINALTKNVNSILNYYIKKAPQYKIIKKQIEVLKSEMLEYKKAGSVEYYNQCKEAITTLNQSKKKFERIVKSKTSEEIEDQNKAIKNSPKLKKLKDELIDLQTEYSKINPETIRTTLTKLRDKLAYKTELLDDEILNLDDDDVDLDEILEQNDVTDDYDNICEFLSEHTGYSVDQIRTMNVSEIISEYKKSMTEDEKAHLSDIKVKIDANKLEASSEMKRLKGYNDITDVMFDIFDFNNEENAPKEMLAASNVNYVKAIAYNICSKLNAMHNYADAVSYGLVGLTVAINKWYDIQKMKDSAISFEGFAHKYVVNSIKRGMYELTSGGMITGSARANKEHAKNQKTQAFKYWIERNQELKDLPEEIIADLIDGESSEVPKDIVTESTYTSMVGGADSDDADIWANALYNNAKSEDSITESKMEYENLVKSLKNLFNMFETKFDKQTGIKSITNKKLFDKYDYRLFLMYFGLITKYNPKTGREEQYNQTEMGKELEHLYALNGIKKTFSQPAINARIKSVLNRIKKVVEDNPAMKKGFEYLMYYFMANRENMNLISNSRDELGISYDMDAPEDVNTSSFRDIISKEQDDEEPDFYTY